MTDKFKTEYPNVILSNGIINTVVFLPDAEKGYYRSCRYDWSGMIWQLKYKNHTYFGEVMKPRKPTDVNYGIGLADEFRVGKMPDVPLGYDEAKPGDTFIKVGVGMLERIDEKDYFFGIQYRMVKLFNWDVKYGKTWIEFIQKAKNENGFGYEYIKRIELIDNKPELSVYHYFRNTGVKSIKTSQYCHNFFIIDNDPIGRNYQVEFPFLARAKKDLNGIAVVEGKTIYLKENLKEPIFSEIDGYSDSVSDNRFIIRNIKTGAEIECKNDFSMQFLFFYADKNVICPEPFIDLQLATGEAKEWTGLYSFKSTKISVL